MAPPHLRKRIAPVGHHLRIEGQVRAGVGRARQGGLAAGGVESQHQIHRIVGERTCIVDVASREGVGERFLEPSHAVHEGKGSVERQAQVAGKGAEAEVHAGIGAHKGHGKGNPRGHAASVVEAVRPEQTVDGMLGHVIERMRPDWFDARDRQGEISGGE